MARAAFLAAVALLSTRVCLCEPQHDCAADDDDVLEAAGALSLLQLGLQSKQEAHAAELDPTDAPTQATATVAPTAAPTAAPTQPATAAPTAAATATVAPTAAPTDAPTQAPPTADAPTSAPTDAPTQAAAESAPPVHERKWFACVGKPPAAPSADDVAAEVQMVRTMHCTKPASIRELCCERFEKKDFKIASLLNLKEDQSAKSPSFAQRKDADVLKVCTVAHTAADEGTSSQESAECIAEDFSVEKLSGEFILKQRLRWFQEAGLSIDLVPKCADMGVTCSDGNPPATVSKGWIKKQKEKAEAAALLEKEEVQEEAARFGAAALLTSGSFTMMAGGSV